MKLKRTSAPGKSLRSHAQPIKVLAAILVACAILLSLGEPAQAYNTGVNNPPNATVDFFDYWIVTQGGNDTSGNERGWTGSSVVNDGINRNHTLLFHGGDGSHPTTGSDNFTGMWGTGGTYNYPSHYWGPVIQGIVQPTLVRNEDGTYGYPVLSPNERRNFVTMNSTSGGPSQTNNYWLFYGNGSTNGPDQESLGYLFNPSTGETVIDSTGTHTYTSGSNFVEGKAAYSDVQGLFTIDEQGYYVYDSAHTAAQFHESDRRFELSDQQGGAYGFWPLDQYSGGATHNHYMGMHMSMSFSIPENGMVLNPQGEYKPMTFTFTGDDDVWVFIDGQLVGDLGGIHQPSSLEINFQDGSVKTNRNDINSNLQRTTDGRLSTTYPEYVETTYLPSSMLVAGSNHRIDFYYLERGAGDSNLEIRFNMISTADFTAYKALAGPSTDSHVLHANDYSFDLIALNGLYSMDATDARTSAPVADAAASYATPIMPTLPNGASYDAAGSWDLPGDVHREYTPTIPSEYSDLASGGRTYTVGCEGNGDVIFGNTDVPEEWTYLQSRDNPTEGKWYGYRYIIREAIPEGATDNGDGTYTKNGVTYVQQTYYMIACPVRESTADGGGIGFKKTYYTDDTFTQRADVTFANFYNLTPNAAIEHPAIDAHKMIDEGDGTLVAPGQDLDGKFSFELYDTFPGASSTPIATTGNVISDGDGKADDVHFTTGLPAFTAVDFDDKDGTLERYYYMREKIPTGATDNQDGTFTLDGVTYEYDTNVYYAKVTATYTSSANTITFAYEYGVATEETGGAVTHTPFSASTNPTSPSDPPVFVNKIATASVSVTKVWEDGDTTVVQHPDATFAVYRIGENDEEVAATYEDGTAVPAVILRQSAQGEYSILNSDGQAIEHDVALDTSGASPVVTWSNLPKKDGDEVIRYVVRETGVPTGYDSQVTGSMEDGFIATNTLKPLTLRIAKKAGPAGAETQPLEGAAFTLTRVNPAGNTPYPQTDTENYYMITAETDASGIATFGGTVTSSNPALRAGTYLVSETTVPAGYQKAPDRYITINADGTATIDGRDLTFDEAERILSMEITNTEVPPLPSTGGPGDALLLAAGGALIIAAMALILWCGRRLRA